MEADLSDRKQATDLVIEWARIGQWERKAFAGQRTALEDAIKLLQGPGDGMDEERCRRIVGGYRQHVPASVPHVATMYDRMLQFLPDRREKFMRWLGFMQGVLWSNDIYTIDELKQHNMTGDVAEPAP